MKMISRTFVLCLMLIALGEARAFAQVGADKRPTPFPKTSSPKTPTKRTTPGSRPTSKPSSQPTNSSSPDEATRAPARDPAARNQTKIELVFVSAGTFMMGADSGYEFEMPVHKVTFREGFYLGRYEVTQAQWQAVMGNNPSGFKGCDQCPVEQVSWDDAQEFIRRLNARGDGYLYRLPTESEWEYACRAGTTTEFTFGDSLSSEQANFDGSQPFGNAPKGVNRQKSLPVGSFQPNAWGLYDMHGNVWEWCEDTWHENYTGAPADGSAWLNGGDSTRRVLRGGAWYHAASYLRSANRTRNTPDFRNVSIGLRVAAVARAQ